MIDDLKWLLVESQRHSSVDTLAKKLTIRRRFGDLERFKIALSVFFTFEQSQNPPDNRYDSFYASIIDSRGEFPPNIRILSWNYDYQFELSFSEYSGKKKIYDNKRELNVIQKYGGRAGHYPGFRIFKLNGTTDVYSSIGYQESYFIDEIQSQIDKSFVENVVRSFAALTNTEEFSSSLSFAWEAENKPFTSQSFIEYIIEDIKDSIAMVVIGYSFPFFNREIDRKVVGSMNQLKRVYFQDPDADALKERFSAIRENNHNIEFFLLKMLINLYYQMNYK